MSGHTGSSVSRLPRAARILGPRCAPPHTPPVGQSLLLGVLGLVTSSWASVAKQAPTERGVQIVKREASLKAESEGVLRTMPWAVEAANHPSPALLLTGCGALGKCLSLSVF